MQAQFKALQALGAGEFQHLNGTLEQHLQGTAALLQQWQARDALVSAGLFHAAYGTAGFDETLVTMQQRNDIANIIGEEAEELVYFYCASDRSFIFKQFGRTTTLQYHDRFTQTRFALSPQQSRDFCELTVANELELVLNSEAFKAKHGSGLYLLFQNMDKDGYLSEAAREAYIACLR